MQVTIYGMVSCGIAKQFLIKLQYTFIRAKMLDNALTARVVLHGGCRSGDTPYGGSIARRYYFSQQNTK